MNLNYPFVCSMPNSDTRCWNYYPGTYTLGWTSHGSALIDNINGQLLPGEDHWSWAGAHLADGQKLIQMRTETVLEKRPSRQLNLL